MNTTASALVPDSAQSYTAGAATEEGLSTGISECKACLDAWQRMIDHKLINWGRYPEQLAEDDLIPPTRAAVGRAITIAQTAITTMQETKGRNIPPPTHVMPDGDGGIVLEWEEGDGRFTIMAVESGSVELLYWRGSKIVRSECVF